VNGWDEDYKAYGLEDNDMDWRLKLLGLKIESLRNQSIIYHLFHKTNINPEKINENPVLLDKKNKRG
jgi:GT2 family glycosyltransferase